MPMTAHDWDTCTCSLCHQYRPTSWGDENLIRMTNGQRFEHALVEYRDPPERIRLRARARARARAQDRSGRASRQPDLRLLSLRTRLPPWYDRPQPFCRECCEARWELDEDGIRTHAHELGRQSREAAKRRAEERRSD